MLARLGATVSDSAFPEIDIEKAFEAYLSLLWGVMAAGLSEEEKEGLRQARALSAAGDEVPASLARFGVQEHGEWLRFDNRRFRLRKAWQAFFQDWDMLICPQVATVAFPHDHGDYLERRLEVDNESQNYFQQLFWSGIITVAHTAEHRFPHRVCQKAACPSACRLSAGSSTTTRQSSLHA